MGDIGQNLFPIEYNRTISSPHSTESHIYVPLTNNLAFYLMKQENEE